MEIIANTTDTDLQQLFQTAYEHHQNNRFDKAEKMYSYLVEICPQSLVVNYNYGLLLFENNLFDRALGMYKKAVSLAPDNQDVLYNYALCLKNCGDFNETIVTYKKILSENPSDIDSLYNLACCYKDCKEIHNAIQSYTQVLELDPDHTSALNNLAYLYHKLGNLEQAQPLYERLVKIIPDHSSALYMLASMRGDETSSAPKEYVTEVFNTYSTHYEESLITELGYDVPNIMRRHFNTLFKEQAKFSYGIDLGCGTGLAALAFADTCHHFTGIDLSEKMLREADKKGLYDTLIPIDIEEYLKRKEACYDIIIAADVFTYLGELRDIFQALNETASDNAYFCFSTEKTHKNAFQLRQTGRFAHSASYIIKLCEQTGWKVLQRFPENLRKENDKWVEGNIFFLQKESATR